MSVEQPKRFEDRGNGIEDFLLDPVLVICPRCRECAQSHRRVGGSPFDEKFFAHRRLVCVHCGLAQDAAPLELGALWLETRCAGQRLWAVNRRHLDAIESFVRAELRERRSLKSGWRNKSLASRLPRWIKASRNREEVLDAIAELKARCGDVQGSASLDSAGSRSRFDPTEQARFRASLFGRMKARTSRSLDEDRSDRTFDE